VFCDKEIEKICRIPMGCRYVQVHPNPLCSTPRFVGCNCPHNFTFESGKIWQRLTLLSTFVYFCLLVGKLWQTCLKTATSATSLGTLSRPHTF